MLVLGIETSTEVSSVSLWSEHGKVAGAESSEPRGHVEFLMPAIVRALEEAGETVVGLTAVAVGLGPGSFTSMRIGIATAKTLAQALGVPIAGASSLDVVAHGETGDVRACIDARRGEVYTARYRDGVRSDEYRTATPDEARAEGVRLVGTGPLVETPKHPHADALCEIALGRLERGEHTDVAHVEPLYVRRTDAEIRWEQRGVVIERPFRVKTSKR